jgi:clan AA aspartic protease
MGTVHNAYFVQCEIQNLFLINLSQDFNIFNIKNIKFMGFVYADIELINGEDLMKARNNIIGEDEIKRFPLNILVDSGIHQLVLNENIQEQLKLPVVGKKKAQMADGRIIECDVVAPVELGFKNRETTCRAIILPGAEPLLGVIPMEDMDVLIDPLRNELIVNPDHPYYAQAKIK